MQDLPNRLLDSEFDSGIIKILLLGVSAFANEISNGVIVVVKISLIEVASNGV